VSEEIVPIDEIETNMELLNTHSLGLVPLWRSQTLFTKEPEMIEWIDSIDSGSTFWDIGANIGLYSIYGAVKGALMYYRLSHLH